MNPATPVTTPVARAKIPKPDVPPGFPLTWHARGYWKKKYRGLEFIYEADADRSLARWEKDRATVDAGLEPDQPRKRFTLRDAVNLYLTRQKRQMDAGDLGPVQFAKVRGELEHHLPRAIRLTTPLDAFRSRDPADDGPAALFHKIRSRAIARGIPVAHRHIVTVRAVLNHAVSKRLMLPPNYGDDFNPPTQGRLDKERRKRDAEHGERAWTDGELLEMLEGARALRAERRGKRGNRLPRNHHLYAQILLGLFAGFDSSDCAALPERAVDLETGLVKFARVKEESRPRAAILPGVVLEAIRHSLEHRADATTPAAAHLMFRTADGTPCNVAPLHLDDNGILERVGRNDTIGQNFKRLLVKLKLKRHRLGFKALRAACRTLLVRGNVHEDIIAVIMGRKFRYAVDDYYIRGDLREEMTRAAKHLETILFPKGSKRTRSRR